MTQPSCPKRNWAYARREGDDGLGSRSRHLCSSRPYPLPPTPLPDEPTTTLEDPIQRSQNAVAAARSKAGPAAAKVCSSAASSCAVETNQHSKAAGASMTPASSIAPKKAA